MSRDDPMEKFDYNASADLFQTRSKNRRRPVGYRRFDTAAEAISFAVEDMPAEFLDGAVLESTDERLNAENIRLLTPLASFDCWQARSTAGPSH